MEVIASILTTLFYMAFILALISLFLPAKFYESRNKSRKQSVLIWLGFALLFFIGISFFAPSVPFQPEESAPEASESLSPENTMVPESVKPEEKMDKRDEAETVGEKSPGGKKVLPLN